LDQSGIGRFLGLIIPLKRPIPCSIFLSQKERHLKNEKIGGRNNITLNYQQ